MARHALITTSMRRKMSLLRGRGFSFDAIAKRLGVGYYAVRARLDPGWAEQMHERWRVSYAGRAHDYTPKKEERQFDRGPALSWSSLDAWLMGDPVVGRSALDLAPIGGPRRERTLSPDEAYIDSYFISREHAQAQQLSTHEREGDLQDG